MISFEHFDTERKNFRQLVVTLIFKIQNINYQGGHKLYSKILVLDIYFISIYYYIIVSFFYLKIILDRLYQRLQDPNVI
jgi:hypothetical protein